MPIPVISSFSLKGKYPIDERMIFETIEDMRNYSQNFLPDMYFCFVKEDKNLYVYASDNTEDVDTGKWRVFSQGEGGTSEQYIHDQVDASTLWKVQHGLGNQFPDILCIDSDGNTIIGDIEYVSKNLTHITFSTTVSGTCIAR